MKSFTLMLIGAALIGTWGGCKPTKQHDKPPTSDSILAAPTSKEKADYDVLGSQLMKKEQIGKLKIGLPLQKTIELLGEPDEKTKAELMAADGEYHHSLIYRSKGIEIDIEGEDGKKQSIFQISISDQCRLKTQKGIGVGSSETEVREAYQEAINPEYCNATTLVAGTIYGGLIIVIESAKVTRITLGAVAE